MMNTLAFVMVRIRIPFVRTYGQARTIDVRQIWYMTRLTALPNTGSWYSGGRSAHYFLLQQLSLTRQQLTISSMSVRCALVRACVEIIRSVSHLIYVEVGDRDRLSGFAGDTVEFMYAGV